MGDFLFLCIMIVMSIYNFVRSHSIQNLTHLKGKKVLLRLDLNISLGNNETVDPGEDWRILKSLDTISFLCEQGASVVILSHIGRDPQKSLRPVFEYMKQFFTIGFIPSYDSSLVRDLLSDMKEGSILMMENVRQNKEEKEDNINYLSDLIEYCDIYVNDAFAVSHREHASVHAVTNYLPCYFGLQFVDEVKHLSLFFEKQEGAKTLILGGAKFSTKLPLLKKFIAKIDYVLLGGALANVFLKEKGFKIGSSFYDDSVDISSLVENNKIIIPIDYIDQHGDVADIHDVRDQDSILDLGPETCNIFETIIDASSMVMWNGPLGKYEDGFTESSLRVADSIAHGSAYSLTGGGDTSTVILENNLEDNFDFISTGGGAMLEFLIQETLPCIEVIKNKKEA